MARFVLVHGGWHGGWCFRRLAQGVIEFDSGHSPFLTQPDELAEILSSLA